MERQIYTAQTRRASLLTKTFGSTSAAVARVRPL